MEKTVAIIGCGPRGLSALEDLYRAYTQEDRAYKLKVIIFERTGNFGSGQVYAPTQTLHNWLNLNDRALTISARKAIQLNNEHIDEFPSYHKWNSYQSGNTSDIDIFSSRATLGSYLEERFNSIAVQLKKMKILNTYESLVTALNYEDNKFRIVDENGQEYLADEVVLTIGHQPTLTSKQIKTWKIFENNHAGITLFEKSYPIEGLFSDNKINAKSRVAIRGFGLAMIDVVRGIAGYTNSYFKIINDQTQQMEFHPGENCPKKIIPFSLDGLPMAPKPLNEAIDKWFKPTEAQLTDLKSHINEIKEKPNDVKSTAFLTQKMASIITEVFLNLEQKGLPHNFDSEALNTIIENYILDDKTDSEILLSNDLSAKIIIEKYIDMATGQCDISLDYCIGQVWRHCQPTLYECLSYTEFDKDITLEIIQLDEKLKRLSFGPPVASLQQLLALINADIMSVKAIDDPDIKCTDLGWFLEGDNAEFIANVMINSVLDAPKILEVETPLIKQLLDANYMSPLHQNLGVKTFKNGITQSNPKQNIPLALLGRLAQGTLLGVDAVLECFGKRSMFWANGVMQRLDKKRD